MNAHVTGLFVADIFLSFFFFLLAEPGLEKHAFSGTRKLDGVDEGVVVKRSEELTQIRNRHDRQTTKTNPSTLPSASDFYSTASARNASIISLHRTKPEHDLKQEKKKRLKLRRSRANNTNGATRTLVIVKGNQEVDKNYLKQHNDFRPILKALEQRIQALKVRRHGGSVHEVSSPRVDAGRVGDSLRLSQDSTPGNVDSANPERSRSTQGLVAVDPEVGKKEEVGELRRNGSDGIAHVIGRRRPSVGHSRNYTFVRRSHEGFLETIRQAQNFKDI